MLHCADSTHTCLTEVSSLIALRTYHCDSFTSHPNPSALFRATTGMDPFGTSGDPPGFVDVAPIDAVREQADRVPETHGTATAQRRRVVRHRGRGLAGAVVPSRSQASGDAEPVKSRGVRDFEKATDGWEVETLPTLRIAFEVPFFRDLFDGLSERYARDVVQRLTAEVTGMGHQFRGEDVDSLS